MLKRVFAAVIAILLFLLFVEVVIGLFDFERPLTPRQLREQSLEYEAAVFSRQRIKRTPRKILWGENLTFHINSYGYRGPEIQTPKKSYRLVIYGGSGVFDPLVSTSWPEQLQKNLIEQGLNIEVINAGLPGASSAEITTRFLSEVLLLKPDAVLIYETWNDVRFFNPQASALPFLPVFKEDENLYLYPVNAVDGFLAENSYLYLLARYLGLEISLRDKRINHNADLLKRQSTYGQDEKYNDQINSEFQKQVKINYDAFVQVARSAGVMPILATQVTLPSSNISSEELRRIDYSFVQLNYLGISRATTIIQDEIRAVSQQQQVVLIDAAKDFPEKSKALYDQVHFNTAGSAQFASYITEQLLPILKKQGK